MFVEVQVVFNRSIISVAIGARVGVDIAEVGLPSLCVIGSVAAQLIGRFRPVGGAGDVDADVVTPGQGVAEKQRGVDIVAR